LKITNPIMEILSWNDKIDWTQYVGTQ
jgi:hypothetical protein